MRHHLFDVENQKFDSLREPLSFAIFGRSEVILAGNSTTLAFDSSDIRRMTHERGGAVASSGKIVLYDSSKTFGDLFGRTILVHQSNVELNSRVDTGAGILAEPAPLPAALSVSAAESQKMIVPKDNTIVPAKDGKVANLGNLIISGGEWKIAPGDYLVESLIVTGDSNLSIASDISQGTDKVRIFIQKSDKETNPFRVEKSSINKDGVPQRFQFWYAGEGALTEKNNSTVCGVIYAPNALVSLSGGKTRLWGAVVADEVRLYDDSSVVFDRKLPDSKAFGLPSYMVNTMTPGAVPIVQNGGAVIVTPVDEYDEAQNQVALLFLSGSYDEGFKRCDALLKTEPSANILNSRALAYSDKGKFELALKDCNEALRLEPDLNFLYASRAEVYFLMGKAEEAKKDANKYLSMIGSPAKPDEMMNVAVCQLVLGNYELALSMIEKSSTALSLPDQFKYKALVLEKQGKRNEAANERQKWEAAKKKLQASF